MSLMCMISSSGMCESQMLKCLEANLLGVKTGEWGVLYDLVAYVMMLLDNIEGSPY